MGVFWKHQLKLKRLLIKTYISKLEKVIWLILSSSKDFVFTMARMARWKEWTWPKCFGSNYHAATRIRAGEGEMKRGSYRAVTGAREGGDAIWRPVDGGGWLKQKDGMDGMLDMDCERGKKRKKGRSAGNSDEWIPSEVMDQPLKRLRLFRSDPSQYPANLDVDNFGTGSEARVKEGGRGGGGVEVAGDEDWEGEFVDL